MHRNQQTLDHVAFVRLLRVNAVVHGIAVGLIAGLGIFTATTWLTLHRERTSRAPGR